MQPYDEIVLWPDGAPTENGLSGEETVIEPGFIGNISEARLYLYPAARANGQAVVVCPGGGFIGVALQHEGHAFAGWFNDRGITFAVLKYRLPNGHPEIPLDDLRQAMRILKQRSGSLRIRSLGVMGASIGGYLAAAAAIFAQADTTPDFQILLYPAVSLKEGLSHRFSRQNLMGKNAAEKQIAGLTPEDHVSPQTAPAFIALAGDDLTVPPENSLVYYRALRQKHVSAALHIYPSGGHSFGFRDTFRYKAQWTAELERWLELLATTS